MNYIKTHVIRSEAAGQVRISKVELAKRTPSVDFQSFWNLSIHLSIYVRTNTSLSLSLSLSLVGVSVAYWLKYWTAASKKMSFELTSKYYGHFQINTFRKCMKPLMLQAIGQIVLLLYFYKNSLASNNPRRLICNSTKKLTKYLPYVSVYFQHVYKCLILSFYLWKSTSIYLSIYLSYRTAY